MTVEYGIRVIEPHPSRHEKAGDVIKLAGPDAQRKAEMAQTIWHGWRGVSRVVTAPGLWTELPEVTA